MKLSNGLLILKPDAVFRRLEFEILGFIAKNGFIITSFIRKRISKENAMKFYKVHENQPFFEDLCQFISSGDIICCELFFEGECIKELRELIGDTNPEKARIGTIRRMFGQDICLNAVHASDSKESYEAEKWIMNLE